MRVIEHYRHSIRSRPGKHLSREGVALARRAGQNLGHFDVVVTSDLPRAIETAIAMGYGVDRYEPLLTSLLLADSELASWDAGCVAFSAEARKGGLTHRASQVHADILRSIAASLPDDGRALVVSHGGIIELGAVGLLPDYDYASWGPAFERCEGVRLYFEGVECTGAEPLRVPEQGASARQE